MLRLEGITKAYGKVDALQGIDAEVEEGEFFSIVGPSGCGKSTLLRIVAGLDTQDGGTIRIDGTDVSGWEPVERSVGMVFQNYALFPHLSAANNIGFGLKGRVPKQEIRRRVEEIADLLELDGDMLRRRPRQLSGGQRQRVALGRALIRRPRILLMDEPLSGADAMLRDRMRTELRRFHDRAGTTTLYVTHDQREAMSMSDRLMVIDRGRVQQVGRPIDVYRRPRTAFAARFLGSPGMSVLPMTVAGSAGRRSVRTPDGDSWLLDADVDPGADRVLVGIRPEHLHLHRHSADAVALRCSTENIEPQGDQALLHAVHDGNEIVAALGADAAEGAGSTVELWFSPRDAHVFSHDSGERLGRRAAADEPVGASNGSHP